MSTTPDYISVFAHAPSVFSVHPRSDLRGAVLTDKVIFSNGKLADASLSAEGLVLYRCMYGAAPPAQSISVHSHAAPTIEAALLSPSDIGRTLAAEVRRAIRNRPEFQIDGFDLRSIPVSVYADPHLDLSRSNLKGCDMQPAAAFANCSFVQADAQETLWGPTHLVSCLFANADMRKSVLTYTHMETCIFSECDLRHSTHKLCTYIACEFVDAKMSHAQFSACIFIACRFYDADPTDTSFENCVFLDCMYADALLDAQSRKFEGLILTGPTPRTPAGRRREALRFIGAADTGAAFRRGGTPVDATQLDFSDVVLDFSPQRTAVSLKDINFSGCSFRDADFEDPHVIEFRRCDLSRATLDGLSARHLRFVECNLNGVSLNGINVPHCTFSHCKISGVTLAGAPSIKDATFVACDISDVAFGDLRTETLRFQNCDLRSTSLQNLHLDILDIDQSVAVDMQLAGVVVRLMIVNESAMMRVDARNARIHTLRLTAGRRKDVRTGMAYCDRTPRGIDATSPTPPGFEAVSPSQNTRATLHRADPDTPQGVERYSVSSLESFDLRGAKCDEISVVQMYGRTAPVAFFDQLTTDESSVNIIDALIAKGAYTMP